MRTSRNTAGRVAPALAAAGLLVLGVLSIGSVEDRAAAAGRVKPKNGLYRGKTAQGTRVSFRVRRGRVTRPSFTIRRRGCGVRITFPLKRKVNRKGRFFLGRRSSDSFTGKFVTRGKVRGMAAVDFANSTCHGGGVKKVRFRARRVRAHRSLR
jgi:hypothetical protein